MHLRTFLATAAAVTALGAVAAPGASAATAPTQTHAYSIWVNQGALADGQRTVKANVKVTNPESSVRRFWSRSTVQQVVRKGVNGGYERPYQSQGFSCVPRVKGDTAAFTCRLRGGDVATTVRLTFTAAYPAAGGE